MLLMHSPKECVDIRFCECALSRLRVRTHRPATAHSRPRECALIFHPLHTYLQGHRPVRLLPASDSLSRGSRERVCSFFQLSSITCCRQPAVSISAAKFGISCKTAKHFSLHFVYILFTNNLHPLSTDGTLTSFVKTILCNEFGLEYVPSHVQVL